MKLYEYEAKNVLTRYGIPVPQGTLITNANRAVDAVAKLEPPFAVKSQVLVAGRGKAGGILFADSAEEAEKTAEYVAQGYPKPVVAFIAGRSAPPEKRMGHAGAIIMGETGTAENKIKAFENAGVKVAEKPSDVAELLAKAMEI